MIEPTVVKVDEEYYLVSTTPLSSNEQWVFKATYETFVFPCDAEGNVSDYIERLSRRHTSLRKAEVVHVQIVKDLQNSTLKLQQKMESA